MFHINFINFYILLLLLLPVIILPFALYFFDQASNDNIHNDALSRSYYLRQEMVNSQIKARGIKNVLVLDAMSMVRRHLFVPMHLRGQAYNDYPLPIGHGQTISQPYIVAIMTELLELKGGEKVLEIGTGSGYQTAILSKIAKEVYSIEVVNEIAMEAMERLRALGYLNVNVRNGDGNLGWPEEAPFDAIIVTAAPLDIPSCLTDQIKVGGILVVPVGGGVQYLYQIKKTEKGLIEKKIANVRFVPMIKRGEDG